MAILAGTYSAKYFGGLGLRTLNPTIIAEIAEFRLKKFQEFFFSRDSWDRLLWSVLVAKLTPLTHYRQNDHFVTLGRKIWNQDPDQILIFFQKFFLPK